MVTLLLAPALGGTTQAARPAFLVKNINPGNNGSSSPGNFVSIGSELYFLADDGSHGRELWRSDGTADSTQMVKDINPGVDSGLTGRTELTDVNGVLVFSADDGDTGQELWASIGTAQGTIRVQDIMPGSAGSMPREFTVAGSFLFFSAHSDSTGRELWALPLMVPRPTATVPAASCRRCI